MLSSPMIDRYHGPRTVDPLKRLLGHSILSAGRSIPRSSDRGPIEAVYSHTLGQIPTRRYHGPRTVDPLKHVHATLGGDQELTIPRSSDRGPIEAFCRLSFRTLRTADTTVLGPWTH